jgi:hypothetical protein
MSNEKSYSVEVSCDDEWAEAPSIAQFTVSEGDAKEIVRLAALVKENDLYKVERFDYRVSYLKYDPDECPEDAEEAGEQNEVRTDCDCINVSVDEFWFSAAEKNSSIEYVTGHQSIKELADHFGIPFSGHPTLER